MFNLVLIIIVCFLFIFSATVTAYCVYKVVTAKRQSHPNGGQQKWRSAQETQNRSKGGYFTFSSSENEHHQMGGFFPQNQEPVVNNNNNNWGFQPSAPAFVFSSDNSNKDSPPPSYHEVSSAENTACTEITSSECQSSNHDQPSSDT